MKSKTNFKVNELDGNTNFVACIYRKNYKVKIHDKIRDFFAKNLDLIKPGLKYISKEFRIIGGWVDIVAKENDTFYFIEVKTMMAKYYGKFNKKKSDQLLKQKKGIEYIISTFTGHKVDIKLIFVQYLRDRRIAVVSAVDNDGKINVGKHISIGNY